MEIINGAVDSLENAGILTSGRIVVIDDELQRLDYLQEVGPSEGHRQHREVDRRSGFTKNIPGSENKGESSVLVELSPREAEIYKFPFTCIGQFQSKANSQMNEVHLFRHPTSTRFCVRADRNSRYATIGKGRCQAVEYFKIV